MKYKAVFFDYDGVLTIDKAGSFTTNKYISKVTGIEISKFDEVFKQYNDDLLLGRISHFDIWDDICKLLNQKIDYNILYEAFKSTPVNTGMFTLAKKLKKSLVVGMITDNKKERIDFLKKHQKLDSIFDPIIVSSEFACNKKSKVLFEKAISYHNFNPEECIFIDNSEENLIVPTKMGITTIHHDAQINDIIKLEKILKDNYRVY